jgi:hypothetical protein
MEDFTKTMRLRDNNKTSHSSTRDKVLRHHNIINSHKMYWSSDHQQEMDTTQNKQRQHCSQKINRSKPITKFQQN